MNTYIVLLRGINVGGHKKVPMAQLRELLTKHGFHEVQTYIQSGNVVLQSKDTDSAKIGATIKQAILDHFGFDVPVFVKTHAEFQTIFNECPFSIEKKEQSYFTILSAIPDADLVEEASQKVYPNEAFVILSDCIYLYSTVGYGNAKYSNNFFEKKLKVSATARNYKTMVKLLEMTQ